jgi:hypothetical protein
MSRLPLRSGLDPIGPFHPYLVFAAVILLDLAAALAILSAIAWIGDKTEDVVTPGGTEWLPF